MASQAITQHQALRRQFQPNLLAAYSFLLIMLLLVPGIVVLILSFSSSKFMEFPPPGFSLRWYISFFQDPRLLEALFLSLRIAFAATLLSVIIGTLTSFALTRYVVRGGTLLRLILLAPLIVPYIVQATGLFRVFLAMGIHGTIGSIIVAHTVIAIPYVILVVTAGLLAVPRSFEDAARTLGANGMTTAWRITLPLIRSSIAASAVFAFITSFDEFVIAFFLASPTTETFPIKMFLALRDSVDPRLTSVSTLLIIVNFVSVLLFQRLAFRRAG